MIKWSMKIFHYTQRNPLYVSFFIFCFSTVCFFYAGEQTESYTSYIQNVKYIIFDIDEEDIDVHYRGISSISKKDIYKKVLPSVLYLTTSGGNGTGFFILKEGILITNAHLFDGEDYRIKNAFSGNKKTYNSFKFLLIDWLHDIAIFRYNGGEVNDHLTLEDEGYDINIFDEVIAVGNPDYTNYGSLFSGMFGNITNYEWGISKPLPEESVEEIDKNNEEDKQIKMNPDTYLFSGITMSMNISAGASGSPILNMKGNVIGIIHSTNIETPTISYGSSSTMIRKLIDIALLFENNLKLRDSNKFQCTGRNLKECADKMIFHILYGENKKALSLYKQACIEKSYGNMRNACDIIDSYLKKAGSKLSISKSKKNNYRNIFFSFSFLFLSILLIGLILRALSYFLPRTVFFKNFNHSDYFRNIKIGQIICLFSITLELNDLLSIIKSKDMDTLLITFNLFIILFNAICFYLIGKNQKYGFLIAGVGNLLINFVMSAIIYYFYLNEFEIINAIVLILDQPYMVILYTLSLVISIVLLSLFSVEVVKERFNLEVTAQCA